MCNPAIAYAGMALSTLGQVQQGREEHQAGLYNARIAEIMARDAEERGLREEEQYRAQVHKLQGRARASLGAKNVELSGSPLDILTETAEIGERDALQIRQNSEREAFGLRSQGAEAMRRGKQAKKGSLFGAVGTLLTGSSSIRASQA